MIGIIGAGAIGWAFAFQAVRARREAVLANSGGPHSLAGAVAALRAGIRAGTAAEAAAAPIVVFTLPWLAARRGRRTGVWDGRVVVDPTNPIDLRDLSVVDLAA